MATTSQPQAHVFAALGTNLGDKLENLEMALNLLKERVGPISGTSRLYSTAPQYEEDQPSFLNIVVEMSTMLTPEALLGAFKSIERDCGRTLTYRNGPRVIDVDVLLYNNLVLTTETVDGPLVIPHERMVERAFVLVPLCDLAPQLVHPTFHQTIDTLCASLVKSDDYTPPKPLLPVIKKNPWVIGCKTYVMGILNVTPDSFSHDGVLDPSDPSSVITRSVDQALDMISNNVDIIDIGGESTRPGAHKISVTEELARVIPVIQAIRQCNPTIAISIDTTKAEVAQQAIEAGANMVNDVSGGEQDEAMLSTVSALRVPFVIMHSRGTAQTMSTLKVYTDVVQDVSTHIQQRIQAATQAGIYTWNLIVDPGIGFAKDGELNLQLLRNLRRVKQACKSLPTLVGTSRKQFIGTICNRPNPVDRIWGTAATCCVAIEQAMDILRVHDTRAMVDVAKMADAIYRDTQK